VNDVRPSKEALGGWQRHVVDEFFSLLRWGACRRWQFGARVRLRSRPVLLSGSARLTYPYRSAVSPSKSFEPSTISSAAASADERWKALGAAAAGMHSRADFHLRQGRVLSRGESHVAGEEELARYSTGPAPDLRDADNRRLGETNERIEQRREAGGPDGLKQGEGSRRVFYFEMGEIEVGIRALEDDDTKARAGVHSPE